MLRGAKGRRSVQDADTVEYVHPRGLAVRGGHVCFDDQVDTGVQQVQPAGWMENI